MSAPTATFPSLTAPAPAGGARQSTQAEESQAVVWDALCPFLFDDACFASLIGAELRAADRAPRVVEFGCGTGHLSMRLLATRPDADYVGLDRSAPNLALFQQKLAARTLPSRTLLASLPADLEAIHVEDTAGDPAAGAGADIIVLPRFLQTIPLCTPRQEILNRVAFLSECRRIARRGARMFIIEAVYGESREEHMRLVAQWTHATRTNLQAHLGEIERALRGTNPDFLGRLHQALEHPAPGATLRSLCRREDGGDLLPLSAWHRLLDCLGFRYRSVQHDSLPDTYLFDVSC